MIPAHLEEASTHHHKRDQVGENKVGQVVAEKQECMDCLTNAHVYAYMTNGIWSHHQEGPKKWAGHVVEETQKQRKIKKHNLDFFHTASEPDLQSPVSEQKEKPGWNFNVEEKEAGNQTPLKANCCKSHFRKSSKLNSGVKRAHRPFSCEGRISILKKWIYCGEWTRIKSKLEKWHQPGNAKFQFWSEKRYLLIGSFSLAQYTVKTSLTDKSFTKGKSYKSCKISQEEPDSQLQRANGLLAFCQNLVYFMFCICFFLHKSYKIGQKTR